MYAPKSKCALNSLKPTPMVSSTFDNKYQINHNNIISGNNYQYGTGSQVHT